MNSIEVLKYQCAQQILKYLLCAFCIFIFSYSVKASDAQFEQANQAYEKANYNFAIEQYESILADGKYAPEIHYNLGNAYFKTGKLGKAILQYERTLRLNPDDKEAQKNLSIARVRIENQVQPLPSFFLTRWWRGLRDSLSSGMWGGLAVLFLWLSLGGFALWLLAKQRGHKKRGFLAGLAGLGLFLLTLLLAGQRMATENNSGHAIILQKETSLRDGADEDSPEIILLHEGTKIQLMDNIGEWHKVRLANGEQGWLPNSVFEVI